MYCCGIDLHQRSSSIEILDHNGRLFKRFEVKGSLLDVKAKLAQMPRPLTVCFEASCGYGRAFEELSQVADHVKVAHPGRLRLIFNCKKKNNRVDAKKLAKLLYLDEVPEAYVPGRAVRYWRSLIELRQKLVEVSASTKNQIQALLRELGIEPPCGGTWTQKGLKWLEGLALDGACALRRDLLVEQVRQSRQKIARVEKELNRIAKDEPQIQLLRTIPGIGPRTAEALLAYIDDVGRFSRMSKVGSYFGWV